MICISAGFAKKEISPQAAVMMGGYYERQTLSTGMHDALYSRAAVFESNSEIWVLSSNDLLEILHRTVAAIRRKVSACIPVPMEHIHIGATHTHAAHCYHRYPDIEQLLVQTISAVIIEAYNNRIPARIGGGMGQLHGCSINRRFLDRPVDPGVGVLRVDNMRGKCVGILYNWGCHPVVLGPDNLKISADYPGAAANYLEHKYAPGAITLFLQGGAGNVNPLTSGVKEKLSGRFRIRTMVPDAEYYGTQEGDASPFHIGNRNGGSFGEVNELGLRVAHEVARIANSIPTDNAFVVPWARMEKVSLRYPNTNIDESRIPPYKRLSLWEKAEISAFGIGDILFIGEPGEVFAETYLSYKRFFEKKGYRLVLPVSCLNGMHGYLVPEPALDEGGMEPEILRNFGLRPDTQTIIWRTLQSMVPDCC